MMKFGTPRGAGPKCATLSVGLVFVGRPSGFRSGGSGTVIWWRWRRLASARRSAGVWLGPPCGRPPLPPEPPGPAAPPPPPASVVVSPVVSSVVVVPVVPVVVVVVVVVVLVPVV